MEEEEEKSRKRPSVVVYDTVLLFLNFAPSSLSLSSTGTSGSLPSLLTVTDSDKPKTTSSLLRLNKSFASTKIAPVGFGRLPTDPERTFEPPCVARLTGERERERFGERGGFSSWAASR
jgi:hypothetical protein